MKETGIVYVRMDKDIKDNAEAILDELGISASAAVQMFYKTIIREQGLPLNLNIRKNKRPLDVSDLTDEELEKLLDEADAEVEAGHYVTVDQMRKKYGIK